MKLKRILSIIAFCGVIAVPSAMAASDGTLGTTSTGTSDITVTIPDLVRITNVGDLAFGTYSGSGDLNQNDDVCIYRNDSGASYTVTVTSAEGSFIVSDGSGNDITYNAYWNDVTGTTGEVALTYNTQTATQTGADSASEDCSAGASLNANFHVEFPAANLATVPAGAYTGTLTILVEPA